MKQALNSLLVLVLSVLGFHALADKLDTNISNSVVAARESELGSGNNVGDNGPR